jgi:ParB-like chromosome segregation protein Spo0J
MAKVTENVPKRITLKVSEVKSNPNNPRVIKDEKFKSLVKSIQDFPEMAEIRPIVVNADMIILGGNMRFKAMKEAGWKEVPVIIADHLTPEQEREFIIKDNTSGGDWDWEMLAMEWDADKLEVWGLDLPKFAEQPDYSILDEEDVSDQLADMTNGVKKSIQIEFEAEHYEEAYALVKFWRERNAYVGSMIMEYLKSEKDKL